MNEYTKFEADNPPPPLMTGEPGSFARRTMAVRVPALIQNVITDYTGQYPDEIIRALEDFRAEIIEERPMRPLQTIAPDGPDWAAAFQPHRGQSWLNIPWYFAEVFAYRRLLEVTNYFGGNKGLEPWVGVDPFWPRKQAELQNNLSWQFLAAALSHATDDSVGSFRDLCHHCVWGNRIDLSHPQLAQASSQITVHSEQKNLLVDDTAAVLNHLQGNGGRRNHLDFICDNAGTELLLDLALADWLLRFNRAGRVTLHVKAHPTFVSDTIPADVDTTLAAIKAQPVAQLVALAERLEDYRRRRRLWVRPDFFWNSSHFFWEIPASLQAELAQATLVIIKGDANYRRLLGDSRCWPVTISFAEAAPYFPAPFVCLRTMKSEAVVGLLPGLAEQLDQEDAEWRVNGKRGVIQACL